jgi:rare lipoprotein A
VCWFWYFDEHCDAQTIGDDMMRKVMPIINKTPLLKASLSHFCRKTSSNRGVSVSGIVLAAILVGCGTTKPAAPVSAGAMNAPSTIATTKPGGYYQDDGPGDNVKINLDAIADAVPRNEPLHSGANRPYSALGNSYVPNVAPDPFRQEGIASWYGRKYHGQKTAIGETYDMYAMTAAHPLLPVPSYARVTNPANGKRVIVRVNDRGPFVGDRIIDLSYVAAAKLDLVKAGSGKVIVERVFADGTSPPTASTNASVNTVASAQNSGLTYESVATPSTAARAPSSNAGPSAFVPAATSAPSPVKLPAASTIAADAGAIYLQLGAFSSAENAESFRARMASELTWKREALTVLRADNLFRVRMGPYATRADAEAIAARIKANHNVAPVIAKP